MITREEAEQVDVEKQRNDSKNLLVRFFEQAVHLKKVSEDTGRPIFETREFVEIIIPGTMSNSVIHEVTDLHKERFPVQWAHYQNQRAGKQTGVIGTPLHMWSILKPHQVAELNSMNFITVESIANATDAQITSIRNSVGMSPDTFRTKARMFLAANSLEEVSTNSAEKTSRRSVSPTPS